MEKIMPLNSFRVQPPSTLKTVNDKQLLSDLESLINSCKLRGEHSVYTIYQKEEGDIYALIYSFYLEENSISFDEMETLTQEEGKFLHSKLKMSGLRIDYLFIVPYYDYIDRRQSSGMTGAVITKDFI